MHGGSVSSPLHLSGISDLHFANSLVGSLGAPLGFEEEDSECLLPTSRPDREEPQVDISDDPLTEYILSSPHHTPGTHGFGLHLQERESVVEDSKVDILE